MDFVAVAAGRMAGDFRRHLFADLQAARNAERRDCLTTLLTSLGGTRWARFMWRAQYGMPPSMSAPGAPQKKYFSAPGRRKGQRQQLLVSSNSVLLLAGAAAAG